MPKKSPREVKAVEKKDIPSASDRPQQSSRAGSSGNVGRVSDFATQGVQLREQERLKRSDTTSSGRAPENPEGLVATFREENKEIKSLHDAFLVHHAPHLEQSQNEIIQTAEASLQIVPEGYRKNALLLGVGHCYDIPLEKLATMFDHITVIEYDVETAQKAIEQLDPEQREKFELRQADLTGIANEFHEKLLKAVNESNTGIEFIASAKTIAKEINEKAPGGRPPRVRANNAFICSQLVMSQLFATPTFPIEEAVMKKFHSQDPYSALMTSPDCQDLMRNVQRGHFAFMALSGYPGARVHFADTFMSKIDLPGEETTDPRPLIDPAVIKPVMEKYFREMKPQAQWLFNQTPDRVTFFIRSHSLEVLPPPAITETTNRITDIIDRITQGQSGPEVRDQIEKDLIQLATQQQRDHVSEIGDLEQRLAASTREKEEKHELVNETIRRLAASTQKNREHSARISELEQQLNTSTLENQGHSVRIHHLEQQLDTSTLENQGHSDRIRHLEQRLAASIQKNREHSDRIRHLELQVADLTQQNQEHSDLIDQQHDLIDQQHGLIGDLPQQLAALTLENQGHSDRISQQSDEIRDLKQQFTASTQTNRDQSDRINQQSDRIGELELQATASRLENQEHSDRIGDLEQQLAASRLEKKEQSDQIRHLRHQLAASTRGNEGQRAMIDKQNDTIGTLKQQVTDLTRENQQQIAQQNDLIRHLTQQNDLIRHLEQQLTASTRENQQQIAQIEPPVRILMGILQQWRSRSGGGTGTSEEVP